MSLSKFMSRYTHHPSHLNHLSGHVYDLAQDANESLNFIDLSIPEGLQYKDDIPAIVGTMDSMFRSFRVAINLLFRSMHTLM